MRGWLRLARAISVTSLVFAVQQAGELAMVSPRARVRWRRWIMRWWGRAMCRAFAVRVRVIGTPPPPGSLVVCNHLSYLDIPVLASCLSTAFVSKAEVASWPMVGMLARRNDTVFLVRERKRDLPAVNDQIERTLARGRGLVVFPEGTSTKGDDVRAFRPALLAPAAERRLAVWPASLSYRTGPADPPASMAVCWWGTMTFGPHVRDLARLDAIEATVEFAPEPLSDPDRKVLAEKLHQAVKSRFRPVP